MSNWLRFGIDVRISPHAIIRQPDLVQMGSHIAIDEFVVITTQLEVGNYVHIAPHVSIIGGASAKLVMGDFTGIAAGCRIVCGSDDYTGQGLVNPTIPLQYRQVMVGTVILKDYVTLGTNVVVHPGVTVGEGTVVGSCSLVTKDLEPWGIYIGIPAKRVRDRRRDIILKYAKELQDGSPHGCMANPLHKS